MKKSNMIYSAPEVEIYNVTVESGYTTSEPIIGGTGTTLPGFGSEEDDLIY
jgi:hypothetical protein